MGNHFSSSTTETYAFTRHEEHILSTKHGISSPRTSATLRNVYENLKLSKKSHRESSISDSATSSLCGSVRLLSFRPASGSIYSTSPTTSSGSLKSGASLVTTSSTGSTNFKRSARGRSSQRWIGYLAADSGIASPTGSHPASPVEELKTAYPVTVKQAIFMPEFPIRPADSAINRIVAETPLSGGKFGDVSRVWVEGKKETYALKRLRKNFLIRYHTVHQAKDEVVIQKSFCIHPFLVAAVDSWQTRTHLCILTQYVEGGDLSTLWRAHGAFPEEVVKIWGLEIGLALDHLHSRGILYRDLKLANTLLDSAGHLKLADFGLAKILGSMEKRAKTICGTLNYMAPEILKEQEYESSADWWSFGIVIYALLVGSYPVEPAEDHILMCEEVMSHQYVTANCGNGVLSPAAVHFLDRILRKNPANRLQTLQDIRRQAFFCEHKLANVFRKLVSPFALLESIAAQKADLSELKPRPASRGIFA